VGYRSPPIGFTSHAKVCVPALKPAAPDVSFLSGLLAI